MTIIVLVLGLVAVGLAIGLFMLERRRRLAIAGRDAADQRTATVKSELSNTRDELTERQGELATTRDELDTAHQRLGDEQQRVASLRVELEVLQFEIERTSAELRKATSGHDATSLWALEMRRSERTWRYHVAPGLDSVSPLADASDQLQVAVEIEASAVREESGTAVDVQWSVPRQLSPGPALAVLRHVQEQLALLAKRSDRVMVRVTDGGDHVRTEVMAVGDDGSAVGDAEPAVHVVACDEPLGPEA